MTGGGASAAVWQFAVKCQLRQCYFSFLAHPSHFGCPYRNSKCEIWAKHTKCKNKNTNQRKKKQNKNWIPTEKSPFVLSLSLGDARVLCLTTCVSVSCFANVAATGVETSKNICYLVTGDKLCMCVPLSVQNVCFRPFNSQKALTLRHQQKKNMKKHKNSKAPRQREYPVCNISWCIYILNWTGEKKQKSERRIDDWDLVRTDAISKTIQRIWSNTNTSLLSTHEMLERCPPAIERLCVPFVLRFRLFFLLLFPNDELV